METYLYFILSVFLTGLVLFIIFLFVSFICLFNQEKKDNKKLEERINKLMERE